MLFPAEALKGEVEFTVSQTLPVRTDATWRKNVIGVGDIGEVDVLVLQRPLSQVVADAIPFFQRLGIAVVVDMDDDFNHLQINHMARHLYNPKRNSMENWEHLLTACRRADLVTTSTPALAEVYGREHCIVIPNCVPGWYLEVQPENERTGDTIGWSGYTTMHPGDLRVVGGAIADCVSKGAHLHIVGNGLGVKKEVGVDRPYCVSGPVPLEDYPQAIAEFDVGVVPLEENRFNASKSYLKGLEYASVGVPFVASPSPEYQVLSRGGIGELADSPKRWKQILREFLDDAGLREEYGEAVKDAVNESYTYDRQAWRWAEAWDMARQARVLHNLQTV